ncbi:hypothetical protein NKR23_g11104 [Pleurostoma richardsiae]|uniref:Uncharacterized protein n=1 Tax=Pleurostoma richardsiae TaxID=41990 RepID=A0AA38R412_9PEZI|nr:hypothetical protein NKR23_g11104 [Pleurostoma richardsiae]
MRLTSPADPFAGAARRPEPDTALWKPARPPITSSSFLPPPLPHPKPWHRVLVPSSHARANQRRVWKRIGGLARPVGDDSAAFVELAAQGQGARKRARTMRFVRSLADVKWDSRVREARDGSWDLVEARVSVAMARDEQLEAQASMSCETVARRTATFPEESLRWVPTKRHNSRWPIEPPRDDAPTIADLQPLNKFDIPTMDRETCEDVIADKPTESSHGRRKSRRLSRRVSSAIVGMGVQPMLEFPLSPATSTVAFSSPMKKSSPTKVSMSPLKNFTVSATPTKVAISSPFRDASLVRLASKGIVLPAIPENGSSSPHTSDRAPQLVFDQPSPEEPDEPEYETRRRVSLNNARRGDRQSGRVARLLALEIRELPKRRHSFLSREFDSTNGLAGRRHTLDLVSDGTEQIKLDVASPSTDTAPPGKGADKSEPSASIDAPRSAVDVDVRMNLDIFGQSPVAMRNVAPTSDTLAAGSLGRSCAEDEIQPNSPPMPRADVPEVVRYDSLQNPLGISDGARRNEEPMRQAAILTSSTNTPPDLGAGLGRAPSSASWTNVDVQPDPAPGLLPAPAVTVKPSPRVTTIAGLQPGETAPAEAYGDSRLLICNIREEVMGRSPTCSSDQANLDATETSPSTSIVLDENCPSHAPLDDECSTETEESVSDLMPDDVSTAIRVELYHPTVAIDIDGEDSHSETEEQQSTQPTTPNKDLGTASNSYSQKGPVYDQHGEATSREVLEQTPMIDSTVDHEVPHSAFAGHSIPLSSGAPDFSPCVRQTMPKGSSDSAGSLGHHRRIENDSFLVTLKLGPASSAAASILSAHTTVAKTVPDKEANGQAWTCSETRASPMAASQRIEVESILVLSPASSPGFKPINGHQRSSKSPSPADKDNVHQDEDIVLPKEAAMAVPKVEDARVAIELEADVPVEGSRRQSSDSDTDLLRDFITRVRAGKTAQAAAAAQSRSRPKRRSGSITSCGSPLSKNESRSITSGERPPLGEKDLNKSPSPTKKRKLQNPGDVDLRKNERLGKPALDDTSPPRTKRRRKRMEAETDSVLSSDFQEGQSLTESAGVRRSTRNRQARLPVKAATPATSPALSHIPVRLAGLSGMMQDGDAVAGFTLTAKTRSEEKDLAAVTRVNTRKNKANSMLPSAVLALQAEDPGWKLRELKSVFEAREAHAVQDDAEGLEILRPRILQRKRKGVRWAETLVRFQGEDEHDVLSNSNTRASPEGDEGEKGRALPEEEEVASAKPEFKEDNPPPEVEVKAESRQEKTTARRTRASRLQPPKTKSSLPSAPAPQAPSTSTSSTTNSSAAAPKGTAVSKAPTRKPSAVPRANASVVRMATRRTKVTTLGMSSNGTPAPKRRTTRTVS